MTKEEFQIVAKIGKYGRISVNEISHLTKIDEKIVSDFCDDIIKLGFVTKQAGLIYFDDTPRF